MNKFLAIFAVIAVSVSLTAVASPAFAKNDKDKGKDDDRGRSNSSVIFSNKSDDSSRLKILTNKNMVKVQEVGPKKLKSSLNYKFKLHEGNDDFRITVPKGTYTSSSEAFVAAVRKAFTDYQASMKTARQNFLTAVQAARSTYLSPTTTPPAPTSTINSAPTIQVSAYANPATITGTNTTLSVLGADDGGENNLTYTWSTVSKPASSTNPTFSVNGTNAAKTTVASFTSAGTYQFQVVVTDAGLRSVTSLVSVTVSQTLTSVTVAPATTTLSINSTTQFTASAFDQFNIFQPSTFFWSIFEGALGGSVNGSTGFYTAPSVTGTYHVIGTSNTDTTKRATSTVNVN